MPPRAASRLNVQASAILHLPSTIVKQQGNGIHSENIQHFIDSAANAIHMGQRQFFTPPDLAEALMVPFARTQARCAMDLMAGSGHLLNSSGRQHLFGIDVDARRPKLRGEKPAHFQADVTRWYPLAQAAGLQADLLLLNPPFSLQWYLDHLRPLERSGAKGVPEAYHAASRRGETIDSTAATLMIALDRLTHQGEGFMICNAATARRLFGDPTKIDRSLSADPKARTEKHPFHHLMRHLWCWVEIPGAVYEGQNSPFDTAVLYFAAGHGNLNDPRSSYAKDPLFIACPSADPDTVARTLATAASARPALKMGRAIEREYESQKPEDLRETWDAVRLEYATLHHGEKPKFNLMIDAGGRIVTHLDPFRKHAYRHDRHLLAALREMHGQLPSALVVQQVTRAALKAALTGDTWRVDPAVMAAYESAMRDYEAVRAPFYRPNPVQSLGWIDEESELTCCRDGIPGIHCGDRLPLRTWIEDTVWHDHRTSLAGKPEDFESRGRELVVELTAKDGTVHHFHVRRDDAAGEIDQRVADGRVRARIEESKVKAAAKEKDHARHHDIHVLLDHFDIPIPKDIAETKPEAYAANLARLDQLEERMNLALTA